MKAPGPDPYQPPSFFEAFKHNFSRLNTRQKIASVALTVSLGGAGTGAIMGVMGIEGANGTLAGQINNYNHDIRHHVRVDPTNPVHNHSTLVEAQRQQARDIHLAQHGGELLVVSAAAAAISFLGASRPR